MNCPLARLAALLLLTLAGAASAAASTAYPFLEPNTRIIVRTTAYNHREADHLKFGKKNALGGTLQVPGADVMRVANASGTIRSYEPTVGSAAADWSRFPVGTRFEIVRTKQVYEVDDYGIALTGTQTIDLYKPSMEAMKAWGARYETIRVLKVGSYLESLTHLNQCPDHPYIVAMRTDVAKRVREESGRPRITASSTPPASASSDGIVVGTGTGTYSGPRPARMPAPPPASAFTRNKPTPPDPNSWNRNKPK